MLTVLPSCGACSLSELDMTCLRDPKQPSHAESATGRTHAAKPSAPRHRVRFFKA